MENSKPKPESQPKLNFKELYELEQNSIKEAAVAFDIDDFTQGADTVQSVYVPLLKRHVKYVRFNAEDTQKITVTKDDSDYTLGLKVLACMMFKADGKTTYEKLQKLSSIDANAILAATQEAQKNFQPQKSS